MIPVLEAAVLFHRLSATYQSPLKTPFAGNRQFPLVSRLIGRMFCENCSYRDLNKILSSGKRPIVGELHAVHTERLWGLDVASASRMRPRTGNGVFTMPHEWREKAS
jgi:hypothetical protein